MRMVSDATPTSPSRAISSTFFRKSDGSATPEKVVNVQKMLLEEMPKWAEPGYFSNSQLDDVRRRLVIDHKREVNKPSAYTKTMAFWWSITGLDYYGSYIENLSKTGIPEVQAFVKKWMLNKQHVDGVLISPDGAKKAGLKDNSDKLVKKYLSVYESNKPKNRKK